MFDLNVKAVRVVYVFPFFARLDVPRFARVSGWGVATPENRYGYSPSCLVRHWPEWGVHNEYHIHFEGLFGDTRSDPGRDPARAMNVRRILWPNRYGGVNALTQVPPKKTVWRACRMARLFDTGAGTESVDICVRIAAGNGAPLNEWLKGEPQPPHGQRDSRPVVGVLDSLLRLGPEQLESKRMFAAEIELEGLGRRHIVEALLGMDLFRFNGLEVRLEDLEYLDTVPVGQREVPFKMPFMVVVLYTDKENWFEDIWEGSPQGLRWFSESRGDAFPGLTQFPGELVSAPSLQIVSYILAKPVFVRPENMAEAWAAHNLWPGGPRVASLEVDRRCFVAFSRRVILVVQPDSKSAPEDRCHCYPRGINQWDTTTAAVIDIAEKARARWHSAVVLNACLDRLMQRASGMAGIEARRVEADTMEVLRSVCRLYEDHLVYDLGGDPLTQLGLKLEEEFYTQRLLETIKEKSAALVRVLAMERESERLEYAYRLLARPEGRDRR